LTHSGWKRQQEKPSREERKKRNCKDLQTKVAHDCDLKQVKKKVLKELQREGLMGSAREGVGGGWVGEWCNGTRVSYIGKEG